MQDVRKHYLQRIAVGKELRRLLNAGSIDTYVLLALGITAPEGNYSAWEHNLGSRILSQRTPEPVFSLAAELASCNTATGMLDTIYAAAIPWLKVSVGSEMAMMLKPSTFWVANTRTVWAHLLLKYDFDYAVADEALRLYRVDDQDSKMAYQIWKAIYHEMGSSVVALTALGSSEAEQQSVTAGKKPNLWFDAIANALYEQHVG
ncbi:hypothetical protein [Methylophilus sp. 14]|uniref:hypothetical protein n=1 Tax=Methylophilus sp. 14 TaxID=2781019 RepID=UPI00188FB5BB|nr:hypothetical protein [Methylophilus sp. 14]MBF4988341.1 hypothetical protein [Methylophilus sp. 14]